jgi:hypothetical protein
VILKRDVAGSNPAERTISPAWYTVGMLENHKNTRKQGDVGLGIAIGYFASQGTTVCLPLTDSQEYDLVVDLDNRLQKVQVKTTRLKARGKSGYDVQLKTSGGNQSWSGISKRFDSSKVDLLFVLTGDGSKYLIPSECVRGTCVIVIGNTSYREFLV